MEYYIYLHRDGSSTPFYIGAGTGDRAWSKKRPKIWREAAGDNYTIEILERDLTLEEASEREKYWIAHFGRIRDGGTLINIKKGGINRPGGWKHTQATRKKIGRPGRPGPNKGKKLNLSEETRIKLSKNLAKRNRENPPRKGKKLTDIHKNKISKARKGIPLNLSNAQRERRSNNAKNGFNYINQGSKWFNNGIVQKRFRDFINIGAEWRPGRL